MPFTILFLITHFQSRKKIKYNKEKKTDVAAKNSDGC